MEERPSFKHKTTPIRKKDHSKRCRSCTGGVIADCVAVSCCPFAVLSFFTLAFFKAPYMMGQRCLGLGKKKGKMRKCVREFVGGIDASFGNGGVEVQSLEIGDGLEDEEKEEAERVWLELLQFGHLGFGRISFTGVQSQSKGN